MHNYLKLTDLIDNLQNYYYKDSNLDESIKYLDIGKFRFAASNTNLLIQQFDDVGQVISDSYLNLLNISLDVNTKPNFLINSVNILNEINNRYTKVQIDGILSTLVSETLLIFFIHKMR